MVIIADGSSTSVRHLRIHFSNGTFSTAISSILSSLPSFIFLQSKARNEKNRVGELRVAINCGGPKKINCHVYPDVSSPSSRLATVSGFSSVKFAVPAGNY